MASVAVGTAFSQTTGVVCEEFDQIQLTHVFDYVRPVQDLLAALLVSEGYYFPAKIGADDSLDFLVL